jgi:hypothetical protein
MVLIKFPSRTLDGLALHPQSSRVESSWRAEPFHPITTIHLDATNHEIELRAILLREA